MEKDLSLPMEWVIILSAENPPLTLHELAHTATMRDVYDAIEFIEFQKYLSIENERMNKDKENE